MFEGLGLSVVQGNVVDLVVLPQLTQHLQGADLAATTGGM
jgi:hypothetical protein